MLFKSGTLSNEGDGCKSHDIHRQSLGYRDCSKRFYDVSRDFSKQYAHIYAARLGIFRNIFSKIIENKWSGKYKVLKLCDLREKGIPCIIVGTLFKNQQLKPSVLKELSDQLEIIPQPHR